MSADVALGHWGPARVTLDARLELLISELSAELSACQWCIAQSRHRAGSRRFSPPDLLAQVRQYETSAPFTERERAAGEHFFNPATGEVGRDALTATPLAIVGGGGEASVCDATFVDGLSDGQIEALFRAARGTDYAAAAKAEVLLRTLPAAWRLDLGSRGEIESALSRLPRRLEGIATIDFFGAPARRLAARGTRARPAGTRKTRSGSQRGADPRCHLPVASGGGDPATL